MTPEECDVAADELYNALSELCGNYDIAPVIKAAGMLLLHAMEQGMQYSHSEILDLVTVMKHDLDTMTRGSAAVN